MSDLLGKKAEIERKLKEREDARTAKAELIALEAKSRVLDLEDKYAPTLGEMGVSWDVVNLTLFGVPEALFVVKIPDSAAVKNYRRQMSSASTADEAACEDQLLFAGQAVVEPPAEDARKIFDTRPGFRSLVARTALLLAGYLEAEKKT